MFLTLFLFLCFRQWDISNSIVGKGFSFTKNVNLLKIKSKPSTLPRMKSVLFCSHVHSGQRKILLLLLIETCTNKRNQIIQQPCNEHEVLFNWNLLMVVDSYVPWSPSWFPNVRAMERTEPGVGSSNPCLCQVSVESSIVISVAPCFQINYLFLCENRLTVTVSAGVPSSIGLGVFLESVFFSETACLFSGSFLLLSPPRKWAPSWKMLDINKRRLGNH